MIEVQFNIAAFEAAAKEVGSALDQVPFAMSMALNDSVFKARSHLIETTWPSAVQVRNRTFLRAALRVEKATKTNLYAAVVDTLGRASLDKHAHGGVKVAKSGRIAVPQKMIRRSSRGVVPGQRPAALPNAFRRGNVILQRTGKGKKAKLRVAYALSPQAKIKQDVPFVADFQRVVAAEMQEAFPRAILKAMATRR